jgi:STE24 endopeptidase
MNGGGETIPGFLVIDAERQEKAKRYAWTRFRLRGLSLFITAGILTVLGPLGGATVLRDWVDRASGIWPLQVAVFFLVTGLVAGILEAPLTYYRGFVLSHRYEMSNQSLSQWLVDLAKAGLLGGALALASAEVLYAFLRWTPDTWWLWTGLAFTVLTVVLASLAPVLILPMFFKLRPLPDRDLTDAALRLAARARTRVRDVWEINLSSKTPAANAAVIGLGRTRKIVLGDTLTRDFPSGEVEVVVAHELGHHVHHDLPKGLALDALLSITGFSLANLALHSARSAWSFAHVWDLGLFPVLAAVLAAWGALSGVISRAYSRRAEAKADAYSLDLTGHGVAFINSEVRLANRNLAWLRPPGWLEALLYTHPAPWRRIAMGSDYLAAASQSTLE